jgi:hypothetical protein
MHHTFPMDELEAAKRHSQKIVDLRDQLDRLRNLVFANTSGICGGLLDDDFVLPLENSQSSSAEIIQKKNYAIESDQD